MPEPTVQVINPTNGAVKPNGVAPKTAQPPAETPPPPASAAPDAAAQREAQLAAREAAIAKREQQYKEQVAKDAKGKSTFGAKLSEHARMSQALKALGIEVADLEGARLNSPGFLGKLYGKNYQEVVNTAAINGVPPADLIADELKRVEERFESRLAERDEKARQAAQTAEEQEYQTAFNNMASECSGFYSEKAADYPVFKKLGSPEQVGRLLAQRIEGHIRGTGKMLSTQEAADGLEADVLGLLEEAVAHEKYKAKLQTKLQPATVQPSSGAPGVPGSSRRTLSNHLTASTPDKAPPQSAAERLERATRVFNEVHAKSR